MRTNYAARVKNIAVVTVALVAGSAAGLCSMVSTAATFDDNAAQTTVPNEPAGEPSAKVHIDRSGRPQVGKASFYANHYSGKTMADGTPMKLYSNNAASLTLPLGSTAKVTNLDTGKSAIVMIRDRGPYVRGRIVDLSPATARLIGMSNKKGLAPVKVTPISLPAFHEGTRIVSLNTP